MLKLIVLEMGFVMDLKSGTHLSEEEVLWCQHL